MNVVVRNPHHFSRGVTLEIVDGICKWKVNNEEQKNKFGTYLWGKDVETVHLNDDGYVDPKSFDDFSKLLNLVFEFTGSAFYCGTDSIEDHMLEIDSQSSDQEVGVSDIFRAIYDTPLDVDIRFISFGYCGCNMGHCNDITSVTVLDEIPKTYGDVMKILGCERKRDELSVYEYPDSVWITIKHVTEEDLPTEISKDMCSSEKIPLSIELNPNLNYIMLECGR